jgi:asparagine synthase (glutamine-hydrolysing)
MGSIAGIINRKVSSVGRLLLQMLKVMSQKASINYSLVLDGELIKFDKITALDEFVNSKEINISTEKTPATSNIQTAVAYIHSKHENDGIRVLNKINGYCIFDGEPLNYTKTDSPNKFQTTPTDHFIGLFNSYFKPNKLEQSLKDIIEHLTGGFVFVLITDEQLILCRDIIGHKPLYISKNDEYIIFSTEKKTLWELGLIENIKPVLPGECLMMTNKGYRSLNFRNGLNNNPNNFNFNKCLKTLEQLLNSAILKRMTGSEVAILFSGGLDSSLLAYMIKLLKPEIDIQLLTACFKDSKDYMNSLKVSKLLGLPVEIVELTDELIAHELKNIIYNLEDWDTLAVELSIPLYFCSKRAYELGFINLFTGQGADELFAGYNRYERLINSEGYQKLNEQLFADVSNIWSHDLSRDAKITQAYSTNLSAPFLDLDFVRFSLTIPPEYKLKRISKLKTKLVNYERKHILKAMAAELGLPREIIELPKVAMQYGSGASKSLRRLVNLVGVDNEAGRKFGFKSNIDLLTYSVFQCLAYPNINLSESRKFNPDTLPSSILEKVKNTII